MRCAPAQSDERCRGRRRSKPVSALVLSPARAARPREFVVSPVLATSPAKRDGKRAMTRRTTAGLAALVAGEGAAARRPLEHSRSGDAMVRSSPPGCTTGPITRRIACIAARSLDSAMTLPGVKLQGRSAERVRQPSSSSLLAAIVKLSKLPRAGAFFLARLRRRHVAGLPLLGGRRPSIMRENRRRSRASVSAMPNVAGAWTAPATAAATWRLSFERRDGRPRAAPQG